MRTAFRPSSKRVKQKDESLIIACFDRIEKEDPVAAACVTCSQIYDDEGFLQGSESRQQVYGKSPVV